MIDAIECPLSLDVGQWLTMEPGCYWSGVSWRSHSGEGCGSATAARGAGWLPGGAAGQPPGSGTGDRRAVGPGQATLRGDGQEATTDRVFGGHIAFVLEH
jgi:hypothetical protein